MAKNSFYRADVEHEVVGNPDGSLKLHPEKVKVSTLMFRQEQPSHNNVLDVPAEEQHIKAYKKEYDAFLASENEKQLPAPVEVEVLPVEPVVEKAPEVVDEELEDEA